MGGALPPGASTEAEGEPEATKPSSDRLPAEELSPRFLASWGPWRRLTRYRQLYRDEEHRWREKDAEKNARGRLPDGENVQVPAVWVAELYTPSTVDGLLSGIRALGWEHGRSRDASVLKWMRDVRQGRHAGWTSLGLVSPSTQRHFMREREAYLPYGVKAALPILMSLTPSTTALVIAFLMTDDSANSIRAPLSADYTTRGEPSKLFRPRHVLPHVLFNTEIRLTRIIIGPDQQRRKAVQDRLTQMEDSCARWVRLHLPGAFGTGLRGYDMPTALLMVTESAVPASEEAQAIAAFGGLSIDRGYDAWASEEWPGLRLVLPHSWDQEGLRLTFACRRGDLPADERGYHDPTSNWSLAQCADEFIRGLLSRWALTCALDGYHEQLADLRDRSAGTKKFRPIQGLKALRSLARTKLYDIVSTAHEIEDFTGDDDSYPYDVLEMRYVRQVKGERPDLVATLRTSQRARAQQVRRDSRLLSSVLSTTSDVSQAIASIRTQRLVVGLTVVSVAVALIALLVSLRASP